MSKKICLFIKFIGGKSVQPLAIYVFVCYTEEKSVEMRGKYVSLCKTHLA